MNFIDASETGFSKWITFSGRASRSEYWYFMLFYYLLLVFFHATRILFEPYQKLAIAHHDHTLLILLIVANLVKLFVLFWMIPACVSMLVRRLHDVNRSGWWYWIAFTIIGAVFPLFVWSCTEGTKGPNRFGPDPLPGNEGNTTV